MSWRGAGKAELARLARRGVKGLGPRSLFTKAYWHSAIPNLLGQPGQGSLGFWDGALQPWTIKGETLEGEMLANGMLDAACF